MISMTMNKTKTIEPHGLVLEALYPREGFVSTARGTKPVFLGHPSGRCDICEAAFDNVLQHKPSSEFDGLVTICGGHLMRLTTRKA